MIWFNGSFCCTLEMMSGETYFLSCCWKLGWPKYFELVCYSSTSYGLCGSRGAIGEHLLFFLMSLNDLKYIEFRFARLLFLIKLVDEWPGDLASSVTNFLNDMLDFAYKSYLNSTRKLAYGLTTQLNCKFNFEDFLITSSVDVSELKSLLLALIPTFTLLRVFRKGASLFWCLTNTGLFCLSFPSSL